MEEAKINLCLYFNQPWRRSRRPYKLRKRPKMLEDHRKMMSIFNKSTPDNTFPEALSAVFNRNTSNVEFFLDEGIRWVLKHPKMAHLFVAVVHEAIKTHSMKSTECFMKALEWMTILMTKLEQQVNNGQLGVEMSKKLRKMTRFPRIIPRMKLLEREFKRARVADHAETTLKSRFVGFVLIVLEMKQRELYRKGSFSFLLSKLEAKQSIKKPTTPDFVLKIFTSLSWERDEEISVDTLWAGRCQLIFWNLMFLESSSHPWTKKQSVPEDRRRLQFILNNATYTNTFCVELCALLKEDEERSEFFCGLIVDAALKHPSQTHVFGKVLLDVASLDLRMNAYALSGFLAELRESLTFVLSTRVTCGLWDVLSVRQYVLSSQIPILKNIFPGIERTSTLGEEDSAPFSPTRAVGLLSLVHAVADFYETHFERFFLERMLRLFEMIHDRTLKRTPSKETPLSFARKELRKMKESRKSTKRVPTRSNRFYLNRVSAKNLCVKEIVHSTESFAKFMALPDTYAFNRLDAISSALNTKIAVHIAHSACELPTLFVSFLKEVLSSSTIALYVARDEAVRIVIRRISAMILSKCRRLKNRIEIASSWNGFLSFLSELRLEGLLGERNADVVEDVGEMLTESFFAERRLRVQNYVIKWLTHFRKSIEAASDATGKLSQAKRRIIFILNNATITGTFSPLVAKLFERDAKNIEFFFSVGFDWILKSPRMLPLFMRITADAALFLKRKNCSFRTLRTLFTHFKTTLESRAQVGFMEDRCARVPEIVFNGKSYGTTEAYCTLHRNTRQRFCALLQLLNELIHSGLSQIFSPDIVNDVRINLISYNRKARDFPLHRKADFVVRWCNEVIANASTTTPKARSPKWDFHGTHTLLLNQTTSGCEFLWIRKWERILEESGADVRRIVARAFMKSAGALAQMLVGLLWRVCTKLRPLNATVRFLWLEILDSVDIRPFPECRKRNNDLFIAFLRFLCELREQYYLCPWLVEDCRLVASRYTRKWEQQMENNDYPTPIFFPAIGGFVISWLWRLQIALEWEFEEEDAQL